MDRHFNEMLGFSTEDVRKMFGYFKEKSKLPATCNTEAMISEMEPWYDNYCFSPACLGNSNRMFNCDMVLYYLRNWVNDGESPKAMLDPNTKTDYAKMKRLLQLDHLDGNRKSIIMEIATNGTIVSDIKSTFSATSLTEPEMFISLLFYYGMLTIVGTRGDRLVLGIPNNNVRKQYYGYLIENFDREHRIQDYVLADYFYEMAYNGKWEDGMRYMAKAYEQVSSVRDSIEGERSIQGFFLAYLSMNSYYLVAPELEMSHGYCDFFLLPDKTHYDTRHCYIIELKYLPKKEFAKKAEAQWQEAVAQIHHYAEAQRVQALRQGSTLHCIVMQFEGWKLERMEEV